jgi:hypothetical protein
MASMHRILYKTTPHVIFLQETLTYDVKARDFMFLLKLDWMSCVVSSIGNSGGLLVSWDPCFFVLSLVLTCGSILLTGSSLVDKRRLTLLNVYGPCMDHKTIWKKIADKGLLAHIDLILVGDLKFTLNFDDILGTTTLLDPLAPFFEDLFENSPLVGMAPTELVPMWRNGRNGESRISKIIDRFYVAEDLIGPTTRYIS